MEEVLHVKAWKLVSRDTINVVAILEQLHADHTEHEDHDEQNESQVLQRAQRGPDDLHPQVEGGPPPGQPQHSKLQMRGQTDKNKGDDDEEDEEDNDDDNVN